MARRRPAFLRNVLTPAAIYFVAYVVLTFPAIRRFGDAFFSDANDGLQNVWNLWWVDWAIRHGTNPWFTTFLHYPQGTSLVAHTLNPFNGIVGTVLRPILNAPQTYNSIVIFSFVAGGVTAFWLALEVTGDYLGSLLCGYLFTFSEYHFAHGQGHLQLIALEWIPLFLLVFWKLLQRPSVLRGLGAAVSLCLVILCDYYYFLFCVLAGSILLGWALLTRRAERPWAQRSFLLALGAFVAASLVLCGPLLVSLLRLSVRNPLIGAHDPNEYSLDLLGPFIPGGNWRFAEWTRWYWQRLPGNPSESTVAWGPAAVALMVVAWTSRRPRAPWLAIWSLLLVFFTLVALGPQLRFLGQPVGIPGPFRLLAKLVPPLKLAGAPVRMSVMTSLCVGLIAGSGFSVLWKGSRSARGLAILLLAGTVFESWSMPQQLTPSVVPAYVAEMRSLPKGYGLFDVDDAFRAPRALYYQTAHEIPMAHGYISRVPASVAENDAELDALAALGQWQTLCELYGFRYLVFSSESAADPALATSRILQGVDGSLRFYDVGRLWNCAKSARGPFPHPDLPLQWQAVGRRTAGEDSGGMCAIDSINSRDPRQSQRPIKLPRSRAINVVGWAFQREARRAPQSLRLRLERSDGTGYEASARRLSRPDVAEYFKDPNLKMAGFQIFGALGALPPDTYRITIVQDDQNGRTLCDSGVELGLP